MSSRKNRSPEEQAHRAKIRELLQESNVSSMADIQNLFKQTIAEFTEDGLNAEPDADYTDDNSDEYEIPEDDNDEDEFEYLDEDDDADFITGEEDNESI